MELRKIEALLDAYFEGQTSLNEEQQLRDFFLNKNVPVHLLHYKPIFVGIVAAQKEQSQRAVELPEKTGASSLRPMRWIAVAVIAVALVGIGKLYFTEPTLSMQEQEAMAAFEDTKQALQFLSENLNKGTRHLAMVNELEEAKNKVFWAK